MILNFDPPDDAAWTLSGDAMIGVFATTPISEPYYLSLFARRGGPGNTNSTATRTVAVTSGIPIPVRMWVFGDNAGQIQLRVTITDSAGSTTYSRSAPAFFGWELWEPGSFTTLDSSVTVELNAPTPGSGGGGLGNAGTWYVDDFELDEGVTMALSKWTAVSNAIDVLKGITGSGDGYNANLGGRVYTRLFTPAEKPEVERPYCSLPLDQEVERIEYEGFAFTSTWRLVGHAFFDDNPESNPLDSQGSIDAAKFRDDLIRAFMADQGLSGQTENCEVTAIDTASGVIDDGIAEVIFTLEFTQIGGAADLEAA